jgi:hypothetical protein
VFEYDRGGNITAKKRYAFTTGTLGSLLQTISYTYGDSNWKDKMTQYNGTTVSYDTIGNPTGDGTWSYSWQAGRQLSSMSKSGTALSFSYDHNGLRTQKSATVSGVSYNEARGLEEIGMIECHTLNPGRIGYNQIHGISPMNVNGVRYMESAMSYLENKAEQFLLNLLE